MNEPRPAEDASAESSNADQTSDGFPVARVRDSAVGGIFRQSRMWWVTLACLLLAVGLAWNSVPERGPSITIRFPQGHGLKSGDAVRYRGIDVGSVTDVRLNDQLNGVVVHVTLTPGGAALNREGTRFWIVRPRLSLTEISGLETAVGAKFIGVSPGDPTGAEFSDFDGLATPPPDELAEGGLEIVLQSDRRRGISTGAPVTWRGVDVGKVLSARLSPDARHVNVHIRIDASYRRLVQEQSRFWVTSGFNVDLGLNGLKLNADSLATIARGGVSFITPKSDGPSDGVSDGHVFPLEAEPEDEWLEASDAAPLVDFVLPETVIVRGQRRTSFIGISRTREFTQTGILVKRADGTQLLTATLPYSDEGDSENAVLGDFDVQPVGEDFITVSGVRAVDCQQLPRGVVSVPVGLPALKSRSVDLKRRAMTEAEECLVIRSASDNGRVLPMAVPLDRAQLTNHAEGWLIEDSDLEFSDWHGAPVVAASDGALVGLLVVSDHGPFVVPLDGSSTERLSTDHD